MVMPSLPSTNYQPISFSGLVSGLDTKNMIQQLIDAQTGPVKIMQAQVAIRRQEADAVKDISSRLANLLTQVKNFDDFNFVQGKTATVAPGGATPAVSVSTDPSAMVGSFKVIVDQLADATRVSSPNAISTAIDSSALLKDAKLATAVTAGRFTINGVQVSVDPTTDTLDAVMQRIRDNVPGVTVQLVPDAGGRNNLLQVSHPDGVTLGSGGDDSNFLSAMNLLSSPGGTTRTSTANLGVTQTGALLQKVSFAGGLTLVSSGSFKVNGVEISYDAGKDSLSTVLSRINNSTAGVSATYDSVNDKVTFVSHTTGSVAISLEDENGSNFLQAIGVLGAAQTLGTNARYEIDTGNGYVTQYSTTNTVTNAVPGVTMVLQKESAGVADAVNVGQDIDGAVKRVQDLVGQFNSAMDFIKTQTQFNKTGLSGVLAGDFSINEIADNLRRMITEPIDGVTTGKTTLGEIGISFGAIGSAVGTTNTLQLDEAKLRAALASDPAGVANVLSAFRATATLDAGGTGSVQAVSGDPSALRRPGKYTITTTANVDGTGYITAVFKPGDGGASITTTIDNVAAGSTNTTLIAGVTLTFKGAMTSGTDTITIGTPTRGLAAKFEQYLDPLTRSDGALQQRQDAKNKDIDSMNEQIDAMNKRLDDERTRLQDKFSAMEQALARLQEQRSDIAALAQMG